MKFLKKINFDAKAIIQDLRDLNDSLINAVVEYQQVIFEQRETIEMQKETIRQLEKEIAEPYQFDGEIEKKNGVEE
jgi:hypothetical protein